MSDPSNRLGNTGHRGNSAIQADIRYPIARDEGGRAVNIKKAMKGRPYQCMGCSNPMVARLGAKRKWHFAHKPPFERCADPDRALHESAKDLIIQGLSDALNGMSEYHLGYPCQECRKPISWNIAKPGVSAQAEQTIVSGTRSDIVISRPDKGPIIIEIVVTHDLEPNTLDSYAESGIPVLKIHPTWDTLDQLELEVVTSDTLNIPFSLCVACKDAAERNRQKEKEIQQRVESMLKRMDERRPLDSVKLPFRPWTHDKFERPMFSRICSQVHANARILTELGFAQAKPKPWLFYFKLPDGGMIFANFGSTEEVAIWEDTAALIHWQLDNHSCETERTLISGVLDRCRKAGAAVRVSFFARWSGDDFVDSGDCVIGRGVFD